MINFALRCGCAGRRRFRHIYGQIATIVRPYDAYARESSYFCVIFKLELIKTNYHDQLFGTFHRDHPEVLE